MNSITTANSSRLFVALAVCAMATVAPSEALAFFEGTQNFATGFTDWLTSDAFTVLFPILGVIVALFLLWGGKGMVAALIAIVVGCAYPLAETWGPEITAMLSGG